MSIQQRLKSAGEKTGNFIIGIFKRHILSQSFGGTPYKPSQRAIKEGNLTLVDTGRMFNSYRLVGVDVVIAGGRYTVNIRITNTATNNRFSFYAQYHESKRNPYLRGSFGGKVPREVANLTPAEVNQINEYFRGEFFR